MLEPQESHLEKYKHQALLHHLPESAWDGMIDFSVRASKQAQWNLQKKTQENILVPLG